MFEFIGFMLGIQYGEKVFNLLGVLFRGAVAILSFFAWLSAWDLLTQYLYISPMYKIIAIALMVLLLLCLPGRSKKRTLFQDISGGMVSYHAGSYVFSGEGDKWDILFYSRA